MELYLMRHGIAEDGIAGQSDSQRRLTPEGRLRAEAVVRMAHRAGMEPSLILTSPYVRAVQTAELAARVLQSAAEIVTVGSLTPDSAVEAFWSELREFGGERAVLVASHEPFLGRLMSFLLASPALQVEVKKGSIMRIDVSGVRGAPRGVLQWLITPKISMA